MENGRYIKTLDYLNHATGEVETLREQTDYSFSKFTDADELNNALLRGEKYIRVSCNGEEYTFRIEDIIKADTKPNPDYVESED
ncbi:hypothetical protein JTZ62_05020 [Mammaliicoccus sciuri]|uniref:hypothetical protein n=1 Tax=Mammaliicoccus sciuri TaxID=1296 RepID=UPI0019D37614|nr:hypothetical protein [Mammaliicoccus sciuri]QSN68521.1 hypothetical protein JTZ62_05020 [Mammaliicoccus sciuri]UIU23263.1 hypothetical protein LLZ87_05035 [Mammaliicoccus sciuri]UIU26169.1 hypothetical protein LLZ92_05035 [Mammaliicoccus sciuri]